MPSPSARPTVEIDDEHAIVEAGARLRRRLAAASRSAVAHHIEWPLPAERPALAQGVDRRRPGQASGCPTTATALLITAAAYADELASRLR